MVKCILNSNNLPELLGWYRVSQLGPTSFSDIWQTFPSQNPLPRPKIVHMINYHLTPLLTELKYHFKFSSGFFHFFHNQVSLGKELFTEKNVEILQTEDVYISLFTYNRPP